MRPFLKTRKLKINAVKSKQLTIPNIAKKVVAEAYRTDSGSELDDSLLKEILKAQPKQELAKQVRLLEKRSSYTPKEPQKIR